MAYFEIPVYRSSAYKLAIMLLRFWALSGLVNSPMGRTHFPCHTVPTQCFLGDRDRYSARLRDKAPAFGVGTEILSCSDIYP